MNAPSWREDRRTEGGVGRELKTENIRKPFFKRARLCSARAEDPQHVGELAMSVLMSHQPRPRLLLLRRTRAPTKISRLHSECWSRKRCSLALVSVGWVEGWGGARLHVPVQNPPTGKAKQAPQ